MKGEGASDEFFDPTGEQRLAEKDLRDVIETIPTSAWTVLPDGYVGKAVRRIQPKLMPRPRGATAASVSASPPPASSRA